MIYCIYTINLIQLWTFIIMLIIILINYMFITLEKQHHILLKSILHTIGKAIYSTFHFHLLCPFYLFLCTLQTSIFYFLFPYTLQTLPFYFMFHLCTLRTAVSCPSVLSDLLRASSAIFLYLSIWDCCDAFVRWRRPLSSSNSLMREDKPVLVSSCKANILD